MAESIIDKRKMPVIYTHVHAHGDFNAEANAATAAAETNTIRDFLNEI